MLLRKAVLGRNYMGRLGYGDDLLGALNRICQQENITAGSIQVIGALSSAVLGIYNQQKLEWKAMDLPGEWEISNFQANISLKDSKPFVHAHMAIADTGGRTLSGHVVKGCKVFACELVLQELIPEKGLERYPDAQTGLFLWSED